MMQQLMYARNPSRERFFTFFKGPPSSMRDFGFSLCQLRAATSSPGRFSLALGAGRPAPKAREKRPGDEVVKSRTLTENIAFCEMCICNQLGNRF